MDGKISGLNHLTLAVSDLDRSIAFYRDVLGCELRTTSARNAYLEAGSLWLCLSADPQAKGADRRDGTHYAFGIAAEAFAGFAERVRAHAPVWKDNRSEGDSLYFLDPDGHKLELHAGSLASRLDHLRANPSSGVTVY